MTKGACSLCQAHGKLVNCVDVTLPHKHACRNVILFKPDFHSSHPWVLVTLCLSAVLWWMIVDQIAHTRLKLFWVYYFHSFWDFILSGLSIGMSIKRVLVTAFSGEVHLTLEDFKSCHRVYAVSVPAIGHIFSPFSFLPHFSSVLCLVHCSLRFSKRYDPFPPSPPPVCLWLS